MQTPARGEARPAQGAPRSSDEAAWPCTGRGSTPTVAGPLPAPASLSTCGAGQGATGPCERAGVAEPLQGPALPSPCAHNCASGAHARIRSLQRPHVPHLPAGAEPPARVTQSGDRTPCRGYREPGPQAPRPPGVTREKAVLWEGPALSTPLQAEPCRWARGGGQPGSRGYLPDPSSGQAGAAGSGNPDPLGEARPPWLRRVPAPPPAAVALLLLGVLLVVLAGPPGSPIPILCLSPARVPCSQTGRCLRGRPDTLAAVQLGDTWAPQGRCEGTHAPSRAGPAPHLV